MVSKRLLKYACLGHGVVDCCALGVLGQPRSMSPICVGGSGRQAGRPPRAVLLLVAVYRSPVRQGASTNTHPSCPAAPTSACLQSFSLVVVYRLDDTYPAPPPRPPAAPAENPDHEIGDLDLSGSGLITFSRLAGPYSYFMDVDFMWTTASLYSAVRARMRCGQMQACSIGLPRCLCALATKAHVQSNRVPGSRHSRL